MQCIKVQNMDDQLEIRLDPVEEEDINRALDPPTPEAITTINMSNRAQKKALWRERRNAARKNKKCT